LFSAGNAEVVATLSQVLEDLVQGELMQFGSKESENERFKHYLTKTYRKTASLIANSCKATAIQALAAGLESKAKGRSLQLDLDLVEMSFEFGKNLGVAFQLIDDVLDFTAQSDALGKPGSGADLRLGLATAPVLFASAAHPQLNAMIMRRFSEPADCQRAFELVMQSNGVQETRFLAEKYCENADKILDKLVPSGEVLYLKDIVKSICTRKK
jgi:decaprenyl-diphosphate synthase subunit 1